MLGRLLVLNNCNIIDVYKKIYHIGSYITICIISIYNLIITLLSVDIYTCTYIIYLIYYLIYLIGNLNDCNYANIITNLIQSNEL